MALGTASAIMLGAGAFSATTSIVGANAQAKAITKQAEFNAQVYDQQAQMVRTKRNIEEMQFNRQLGRLRGSVVARTAGKGFLFGGSPAAILADTESQLLFDQAINDYNSSIEENYAKSGASYYRQSGAIQSKLARTQGYSNAFSQILNTAGNTALLQGYGMPKPRVSRMIDRPSLSGGRAYKSPYGNTYF